MTEEMKPPFLGGVTDLARFFVRWPEDGSVDNPFEGVAVQNWHQIHCHGRWAVDQMLQDYEGRIIYSSRRETAVSASKSRQRVVDMVIRLTDEAFASFDIRHDISLLRVWATSASIAQAQMASLRAKYLLKPKRERNHPQFQVIMMTAEGVDTHPVSVIKKFVLSGEQLGLHYGADFPEWAENFIQTLKDSPCGVSIFRGNPGTGKTSFIRHLIYKLQRTHRFFYLPVKFYNMLSSPSMVEFWVRENLEFASQSKVIIVEDAESLLMPRASDNGDELSNLLNISDGLLGEFLKLHVICTVNCKLAEIDAAVIRPGRLVAIRDFRRLRFEEAQALAIQKGISLRQQDDYSLAEIYANSPATMGAENRPRPVGFSPSCA